MFGYILRRLFSAALVVVITTFLTFSLFYNGATNVAEQVCFQGNRCSEEKLNAIEEQMGYHDGTLVNYGRFMKGLVQDRTIDFGPEYHCDAPCLGISFKTRTEVTKDLVHYYPPTFWLAVGGGLLYLLIGVPLGVIAARYRGSVFDKGLIGFALVIESIPYYVFAMSAFIFLTLQSSVFPTTGYTPLTENPGAWFAGFLLPWVVLGITGAPMFARYTRGQMLEAMGEDYLRTARAKGLSARRVLYRHGLRAAIVPIVTIWGLSFASLLSGTIFTEVIFDINGIGAWTINSLRPPDFPIINATVLIFAVLVVLANLVVDLFMAVLDPRVRLV